MKLEHFKELIDQFKKQVEVDEKLYALGVDLINIQDNASKSISLLLQYYYGIVAADTIEWIIYEDPQDKCIYDSETNKVIVCSDTIKKLWKYCEELREEEYEEPEYKIPLSEEERLKIVKQFFEK